MFAPAKLEDCQTVRIGPQHVRYVRRRAPEPVPEDLPIVVLHGWGAHIEAVGPILAALEGAADVIALDLPGFGESEPPPEPWDVDSYARFIIHFLDEMAVERAHLVGHSHGGRAGRRRARARRAPPARRPSGDPAQARLALPAARRRSEAGQADRDAGPAGSTAPGKDARAGCLS